MKFLSRRSRDWPRRVTLGDVSLYVDVVGHGEPVLLMHGGPSADLWTMGGFRTLADEFTLVLYDHRCNGRSTGPPVSSMTWENLVGDAEALREYLGFERWTVLGHSFGGFVALEYALRHPDRVSRLVLVDTGADGHWGRENAPRVVAERGFSPERAELVRRWFTGDFRAREYPVIFWRISGAYMPKHGVVGMYRAMRDGGWRSRIRVAPFQYVSRSLMPDWSVVDRLGEITAPTLVIAGREDFVFPPDCQRQLAEGIPGAQLLLVDEAGHNPQDEMPAQVLPVLRSFLQGPAGRPGTSGPAERHPQPA